MPVAERSRPKMRRAGPPSAGWWGNGPSPLARWPGVTIDIPAIWVPLVGHTCRRMKDRETGEVVIVWSAADGSELETWHAEAGGRWETPDGVYYFDADDANRACEFFPTYLSHHIGEFAGRPFDLLDYQSLLLIKPIFGWKRAVDGLRRFRKVFAFLPKGAGKALAINTAIPTPNGWTSMADLQVGDQVFDESGRPCRVLATTDVMQDRPCYRVRFDDGAEIVCDADHQWWTEQRSYNDKYEARRIARRVGLTMSWRFGVRTAAEIAATQSYTNGKYQSANHSVALAGPLQLPDADLPIEPYALGVWLGDGDSDSARITMGSEDRDELIDHLRATGTDVSSVRATNTAFRVRIGGVGLRGPAGHQSLQAKLRRLGLLRNKHVPTVYHRASAAQRLALLQGLMDTDGSIAANGACEFSSTSKALASGCLELLISLGIKARVREGVATLNGRAVGTRWRIWFKATDNLPVFRLARKRARQKWQPRNRRLSQDRRIIACEPVTSVPVKCISVDSPSSLYLAGESMVPTHNSPLGAGIGLYLTLCDREPAAEVYAVAADKEQARTVHTNAKIMVEECGDLADMCEVWKDAIYHPLSRSTYKVISSDASTKHGFRPHGVIFDEFHAQKNRDLYEALKKSMVKRRQPLMLMITHAGDNDEGICYEEYEYAKRVLSGSIPDDSCLPIIFEAQPADDWKDPELWRRTNPGHGITVQAEGIAGEAMEAQADPRKLNDFLRFHLNRWVNQATAWIPIDWWDACKTELDDAQLLRLPCVAGLDLAQKYDLAAFVIVFRRFLETAIDVEVQREEDGGKIVKAPISLNYELFVRPFFWIPEETMIQHEKDDGVPYTEWTRAGLVTATPGSVIDYTRIYQDIVGPIATRYPMIKQGIVGYDPAFATDLATQLRDRGGFRVAEVLQNYKHLSEPSQIVEALIKGQRLHHDGHRVLRQHWENIAVKTDPSGRIYPVKPRRTKRIDGAVATIIGTKALAALPEGPEMQMFIVKRPR